MVSYVDRDMEDEPLIVRYGDELFLLLLPIFRSEACLLMATRQWMFYGRVGSLKVLSPLLIIMFRQSVFNVTVLEKLHRQIGSRNGWVETGLRVDMSRLR